MSEPFFPIASFHGDEVPLRFEADVHDCVVAGTLPPELQGTLYRCGPDRQFPSMQGDHILNGDGMVLAVNFDNGHVAYRNRWVRTERFLKEREARRRLYGAYRNRFTDAPETRGTDRNNTANTNVLLHGGRLFALREDSPPTELDPVTLATRAPWDFGGRLRSTNVTAHPKIDPDTGEWWSFGFFARGTLEPDMSLQVIDARGELVREEFFRGPYPGLAHDFAVTEQHVVFIVQPCTVDEERIRAGGDYYRYDGSKPTMFGVMSRHASVNTLRWFALPEAFSGHVMNAFTDGQQVHVDLTISPGCGFPFYKDVAGQPVDRRRGLPTISRVTLHLEGADNRATLRKFEGADGEMPRVDPRHSGKAYRYGYFKQAGPRGGGIARLDVQTGEIVAFDVAGAAFQEPIFSPRSADAPEGDGFVFSMALMAEQGISQLYVLDGLTMKEIARVVLPFRVPYFFHGNFVPR